MRATTHTERVFIRYS